jgi:Cytochrome C oxidase, cbb3-type, subunit III
MSRVLAIASIVIGSLSACRQDMRNDSRLKPLEETAFFVDRNSSRPLVKGTIPRGGAHEDEFFWTGESAGHLVKGFPSPPTAQQLNRGRERYNIYCSVCHGVTGGGDGMVVQRGFPSPPSFHEQRLRDAPEGHFFNVITNGYGAMYSYGSRVNAEDRWAIIAYIRALQISQNSRLEDVPTECRTELDKNVE